MVKNLPKFNVPEYLAEFQHVLGTCPEESMDAILFCGRPWPLTEFLSLSTDLASSKTVEEIP